MVFRIEIYLKNIYINIRRIYWLECSEKLDHCAHEAHVSSYQKKK